MNIQHTDRIVGALLVVFAAGWCSIVVATIPAVEATRLGARGFPLGLGILLGFLGFLLFAKSWFASNKTASLVDDTSVVDDTTDAAATAPETNDNPGNKWEIWAVVCTILLLCLFAFLLEYTGFVIATATIVAIAVGPVLGYWRWRLLLGMSLGISVGIYLVFGKLLNVYLPYGKWINLGF